MIAGVPSSREFFDIVFFAVLFSTLLQGSTFEALADRLDATTSEPALPQPLAETRGDPPARRRGARASGPARATRSPARRVSDLGLPRDAMVNVIVRGDQAIPPRGSTRLHAGDRLHLLVRQETADEVNSLIERWHEGPIGPAARPPRKIQGRPPVFTVRPWREGDGDPGRPRRARRRAAWSSACASAATSRARWSCSRTAATRSRGPLLAVGGREDLTAWASAGSAARNPTSAPGRGVIGTLGAEGYRRPMPATHPEDAPGAALDRHPRHSRGAPLRALGRARRPAWPHDQAHVD